MYALCLLAPILGAREAPRLPWGCSRPRNHCVWDAVGRSQGQDCERFRPHPSVRRFISGLCRRKLRSQSTKISAMAMTLGYWDIRGVSEGSTRADGMEAGKQGNAAQQGAGSTTRVHLRDGWSQDPLRPLSVSGGRVWGRLTGGRRACVAVLGGWGLPAAERACHAVGAPHL